MILEFVAVLEKVCSSVGAPEMADIVISNPVIARETQNLISRYAISSFDDDVRIPAPLMLHFLRIYNQTHPGKNLDPRNVASIFKEVYYDKR